MKNNNYKQTEIGEIPEDWGAERLSDVLSEKGYIRGPFGSSLLRSELKAEGVPVYEQQHVIDNHRNFRYFIGNAKFNELSRFTVKENDLLVSCSGTLGKVSIIAKDDPMGIISQALLILRPDTKKILPALLRYFFTSNLGFGSLSSLSSGSVQVNLAKREIIENLLVPLPPIDEQTEIVKVLSVIDDKIELNRKMNKTLEEIGKSLFKRWFVNFEFPFDFVQGKPNFNGKPYKSSGGKMVDSELGEIPKGWEIKDLNYITEIKNGFAFKSEDYRDDGVFVLRTRNFSQSEYVVKDEVVFVPESFYEDYKTFQLRKFDVLLVMVGASVGQMGFVTSNALPALQNQNMWNFRARNLNNQIFTKQLVTKIVRENIGSASGSARDFFRKDFFRTIKFACPNNNILEIFNMVVMPMYEVIDKNHGDIEKLTQIRDSLLPRLMSGKLRVTA